MLQCHAVIYVHCIFFIFKVGKVVVVTEKPQKLLKLQSCVHIDPLLKGTDIFSMLKHLVVDILVSMGTSSLCFIKY